MAPWAANRSRAGFAGVNGAKLHYEVAGEGTSLVLAHSGITDSRSWEPQFPAFTGKYRVLRYDLRGFGQSDIAHGAYSNVHDLLRLMATVGMPSAALLGVSLGGSMMLDTALQHPEVVTALILVACPISGREHSADYHHRIDEIDQALAEHGLDAAIDREMEFWVYGRGRTAADVDPQFVRPCGKWTSLTAPVFRRMPSRSVFSRRQSAGSTRSGCPRSSSSATAMYRISVRPRRSSAGASMEPPSS